MFKSNNPVTVGIYTALAGYDVACAWRFVNEYVEPSGDSIHDHIRACNRYWREQLSGCMVNTMNVRAYLIDNCDLHDWLRLFAQNVAPVIVSLSLPQELPAVSGAPDFSFAPA